MPLSEHEQRLLDQIEKALYAEDPKFASTVRSTDPRSHAKRRVWLGGVLAVAGIALLMVGLILQANVAGVPVVSVLGFLLMLGGAVLAATSWKRLSGREPLQVVDPKGGPRPARRGSARRGSIADRMEDRWRRRDDQQH